MSRNEEGKEEDDAHLDLGPYTVEMMNLVFLGVLEQTVRCLDVRKEEIAVQVRLSLSHGEGEEEEKEKRTITHILPLCASAMSARMA